MVRTAPSPDALGQIDSYLEWWRAAGVDRAFDDAANDWLAPGEANSDAATEHGRQQVGPAAASPPPAAEPAQPEPERIGGERADWPTTLDDFTQWLLRDSRVAQTLPGAPSAPLIGPTGPANASLMIVVPQPEEADRDALLSGQEGELLDSMLAAMGCSRADTYIAPALPRRIAMPDWEALAAAGLGELLAHHIALAGPQRVLVLGRGILPLFPHDTAQGTVALREFAQDSVLHGAGIAAGLDTMLARSPERARFWKRWLDWTA